MSGFPFSHNLPVIEKLSSRISKEPSLQDLRIGPAELTDLLNAIFWASTQREEGVPTRASLVLLHPDYSEGHLADVLPFSESLPVSSHNLVKLAASYPFDDGAIAATFDPVKGPCLWGLTIPKAQGTWLIEILEPGYIVIWDGFNLQSAVLPSGEVLHLSSPSRLEDEWLRVLQDSAGHTCISRPFLSHESTLLPEALRVLARSMIEHHRGGTLVVGDKENNSWMGSMDFTYKFSSPQEYLVSRYTELKDWRTTIDQQTEEEPGFQERSVFEVSFYDHSHEEYRFTEALRRVAGLTAVDGALVLTDHLELIGYGAKLKPKPEDVAVREWMPKGGLSSETKSLADLSGMRHRSAAQFAIQHPQTVIFVASQDGRFTVFLADEYLREVNALRTELLLLERTYMEDLQDQEK